MVSLAQYKQNQCYNCSVIFSECDLPFEDEFFLDLVSEIWGLKNTFNSPNKILI